jgi:hypothetical protein
LGELPKSWDVGLIPLLLSVTKRSVRYKPKNSEFAQMQGAGKISQRGI